jgi:hypothetical protein
MSEAPILYTISLLCWGLEHTFFRAYRVVVSCGEAAGECSVEAATTLLVPDLSRCSATMAAMNDPPPLDSIPAHTRADPSSFRRVLEAVCRSGYREISSGTTKRGNTYHHEGLVEVGRVEVDIVQLELVLESGCHLDG